MILIGFMGNRLLQGKVPFVSLEVLHQLHIFIFVLAVTHVGYSLVTVLLGFARVRHSVTGHAARLRIHSGHWFLQCIAWQ